MASLSRAAAQPPLRSPQRGPKCRGSADLLCIQQATIFEKITLIVETRPASSNAVATVPMLISRKIRAHGRLNSGGQVLRHDFDFPPKHTRRPPRRHSERYICTTISIPQIEITYVIICGADRGGYLTVKRLRQRQPRPLIQAAVGAAARQLNRAIIDAGSHSETSVRKLMAVAPIGTTADALQGAVDTYFSAQSTSAYSASRRRYMAARSH